MLCSNELTSHCFTQHVSNTLTHHVSSTSSSCVSVKVLPGYLTSAAICASSRVRPTTHRPMSSLGIPGAPPSLALALSVRHTHTHTWQTMHYYTQCMTRYDACMSSLKRLGMNLRMLVATEHVGGLSMCVSGLTCECDVVCWDTVSPPQLSADAPVTNVL